MLDSALVPTSMIHSSRLQSSEGTLLYEKDSSTYRRLIGRLIYLTNTRPDITFNVNNLNQFLSSPTKAHQQAVFVFSATSKAIRVLVSSFTATAPYIYMPTVIRTGLPVLTPKNP